MSDDDDKEGKDDKDDKELRMSFDPMTIGHLGGNMYSSLPNALAELIANAYDADASCVRINLHDNGSEKFIEVIDDGVGMDFVEINRKFLRIGRNRREEKSTRSPSGDRKVTGKKGLGKLALFGIVQKINIETTQEGMDEKIVFKMDWDDIMNSKDGPYKPIVHQEPCVSLEKGTKITLRDFKKGSSFDKERLAISLSKLFVFFDEKFKCWLTLNDDEPMQVDEKLKYKNLPKQFSWAFPESAMDIEGDFEHKDKIHGEIISTEKPLRSHLRGITLYANGRLVNAPEFFGGSESSHAYSYLTGWLKVDYIDEFNEDVILTNRQSLTWENEEMDKLRKFLSKIVRKVAKEWREKWKKAKEETISEDVGIDIEGWLDTVPENLRGNIREMIEFATNPEKANPEKIVSNTLELVPKYPKYHWRHLHEEVQKVSEQSYQNKDYHTAFYEAAKHYINEVKRATGSQSKAFNLMREAFVLRDIRCCKKCKRPFDLTKEKSSLGGEKHCSECRPDSAKKIAIPEGNAQPALDVIGKYVESGTSFDQDTFKGIQNGQGLLSQGVVAGVRNTMGHEVNKFLKDTGLFTEKDCLDALSILSHLFRRLDDAIEFLDSQDKTP